MASLETRAFLNEVEDAVGDRLTPGERKMAVREVRGVLRDLAFEFAVRKRRPDPTDLDWSLALHCVRDPVAVADHLVSLRPRYQQARKRGRIRRGVILAVLVLGALVLANAMAGQVSHTLVHYTTGVAAGDTATRSQTVNFTVPSGMDRLDYSVNLLFHGQHGSIVVTFLDPSNRVAYQRTYTSGSVWDGGTLPATPGAWRLVVDLQDVSGSVGVDVSAIGPRGS